MAKGEIILIGAGGHCKSCIDVIEKHGRFQIAGIVDRDAPIGTRISGYQVIGSDDDLSKIRIDYEYFLITVGQPNIERALLYDYLVGFHFTAPKIISPKSYIGKDASIGDGSIIMHKALINNGVSIGKNCIINTGAIIEHDVVIKDHSNICPGVVISGRCEIGTGTFIGSNATLVNDIRVVSDTLIGAGACVIKDINIPGTYVGNPAHKIVETVHGGCKGSKL